MTAEALLREARAAGARIAADGERVRVWGQLPEDLLCRLREHRDEVLEFLRREAVTPSAIVAEDVVKLACVRTEAHSAVVRDPCVLPGARVANAEPLPKLPEGVKAAVYFRHRDGVLTLERIIGGPNDLSAEAAAEAPAEPVRWSGKAIVLIAWFQQTLANGRLPAETFQLGAAQRIADPARWYRSVDQDIARGPRGPRAGVLIEELRRLREIVETNDSPA